MAEDQKNSNDDALVMIYTRNSFYRRKYQVIMGIVLLSFCVIGFLASVLAYLIKAPPHPLYFVTDDVGRLIQDVPVTEANMSNKDVAEWVKEAVVAAYTYDFHNYRGQLQAAQKYFTDYGWRNYMKGLEASDNLLALTTRQWIVSAQVIGEPKLLGETRLGKAQIYAWKFEMPVLVTYYSPPYDDKSKVENPIVITVIVERASILSSYKGLGIAQLVGTMASS